MTNRIQILRSSTTGNVPAAGTRQAGELWLNFADFQLGMIDASKNAQKLVAVRYFQTTANYAANDAVVQAGALYVANTSITAGAFSAAQWTKIATASDVPGASSTTPAMDGAATVGTGTTYARADHIHPTDTSRASVASVPAASSTTPAMNGTAAVGTATTYARADHVHPSDTSRLALTGGTLTGALTPSQTAGIVGTTAANNANAGSIGEQIIADQTTNVSLVSAGVRNITSISLSAGDWDVEGSVFVNFSAGGSQISVGISTTSATLQGGTFAGQAALVMAAATISICTLATGSMRVSVAATTPVYLVAGPVFASGTCNGQGSIRARRMR